MVNGRSGLSRSFVDGIDGFATEQALFRFQLNYKFVPDGEYGPETAEALTAPVTGECPCGESRAR